jgi:hypothetical protein
VRCRALFGGEGGRPPTVLTQRHHDDEEKVTDKAGRHPGAGEVSPLPPPSSFPHLTSNDDRWGSARRAWTQAKTPEIRGLPASHRLSPRIPLTALGRGRPRHPPSPAETAGFGPVAALSPRRDRLPRHSSGGRHHLRDGMRHVPWQGCPASPSASSSDRKGNSRIPGAGRVLIRGRLGAHPQPGPGLAHHHVTAPLRGE